MKKICGLLIVFFLSVMLPSSALCVTEPGLDFEKVFMPESIEFPSHYAETYKGVVDARKAFEVAYSKWMEKVKKHQEELDAIQGRAAIDKVRKLLDKANEKFNKTKEKEMANLAELKNAFFFLSNEELKKGSDPYFLYYTAYLLWDDRGTPPAMNAQKVGSYSFFAAEDLDEFNRKMGIAKFNAEQKKREEEGKKEEGASTIATKKYSSNYEKMIDCLMEIDTRFKNFEHMEKVLRFLAFAKGEMKQLADSLGLYKRYLTFYIDSPNAKDVMWEVAELRFSNRTGYDTMNKAVGLYTKALEMEGDKNSKRAFRIRYKIGWAQYLSSDLKEEAINTFASLYKDIKSTGKSNQELITMQSECVQVVKQIKAIEAAGGTSSFQ